MDLRLYYPCAWLELASDRHRLVRGGGHIAVCDRSAVVVEQRFGLILVDIHGPARRAYNQDTGAARLGAILWQSSTSDFTDSTDFMKASRSAELRSSSMTRSTPLA